MCGNAVFNSVVELQVAALLTMQPSANTSSQPHLVQPRAIFQEEDFANEQINCPQIPPTVEALEKFIIKLFCYE